MAKNRPGFLLFFHLIDVTLQNKNSIKTIYYEKDDFIISIIPVPDFAGFS